ncbi:MAG: hypothetical protein ACMG6E_07845 [Candidatus Roizmanbacteria bacterium]
MKKKLKVCFLDVNVLNIDDVMYWTPELCLYMKRLDDPEVKGVRFTKSFDLEGPTDQLKKIPRYFNILETITFDVPSVILHCCSSNRQIVSGELLNFPNVGTNIDFFIQGTNQFAIRGIVYESNLWKKESDRGYGTFNSYAYDFK